MRVGIVAPSSPAGSYELGEGVRRLERLGVSARVHPQVGKTWFIFAGTDAERAAAILEFAHDDEIDVIWAARGGNGAARLLPILANAPRPTRRKTLVGYSDITVLHEFARRRWGWRTLHAVMPAANFGEVPESVWIETVALLQADRPTLELAGCFALNPPANAIDAELVGGNLSLVHTLVGTPWWNDLRGKLLFLEDTDEKVYSIDRYAVQLEQAGAFDGLAAIVLGDFTNCTDEDETKRSGSPDHLEPLRPAVSPRDGLLETFGRIAREKNLPLLIDLPVGHGPNFRPLPLGASYRLSPDGKLILRSW